MSKTKTPHGKKTDNEARTLNLDKIQETCSHTVKYKYSTFDELIEQGEYNFYGMIYDSSFPEEETQNDSKKNSSKYVCVLKLIDQSTNCLTNNSNFNDNIIYLVIKSNEKENVPFVHRIGDIIRVHSGLYAPKHYRTVYLNVLKDNKLKGSWAIFPTDSNSNEPISCSNKKFTVESEDKQVIDSMKAWIKKYSNIDNSLVYEYQVKLENRMTEGDDKDLLVHVVKKISLDDQLVLFVQDDTDGCELHTYKYYDFVEENDVIRVRSYKVFDSNNLVVNEYGNILVVPTYSSAYKNFVNSLMKKLKDVQK